ncbi:hypothetical protein Mapa_009014 [Marchantia paleacea]|nr:hypothetical protein Mapa_009014 [Marchantia paleacea]
MRNSALNLLNRKFCSHAKDNVDLHDENLQQDACCCLPAEHTGTWRIIGSLIILFRVGS